MDRLFIATLIVMVPFSAAATGVFLNGVRIDGARDQTFENATVRIDESGNVHIDAPRYRVTGAVATTVSNGDRGPPSTQEAPAPLNQRYFLVTRQSEAGATQYEIDVFINARWVRKLKSEESQVVVELTEHLRPGSNRIILNARKSMQGGRRSHSPEHTFRVVIGEGDMGGNRVMIDRPLIQFERNAAEVDDVSREFDLDAR